MAKAKVTFLMPAYNAEEFVVQAVQSVLNQQLADVQLIVRNNGSTDGTLALLRGLAQQDSRVVVLTNKVNHLTDDGYKMYQRGWWGPISEMGEYIAFLDSDDVLAPDFATKMVRRAEETGAEFVVGGCYFTDKNGGIIGKRLPPDLHTQDMTTLAEPFGALYGPLRTWWGKLYRNDFFDRYFDYAWAPVPPPTGGLPMDTCVVLRYLENCTHIATVPEPLYHFRYYTQSTYSSSSVTPATFLIAKALYEVGMHCIKKLGIDTPQNLGYLCNVNYGFYHENFETMAKDRELHVGKKLAYVELFLDDPGALLYIPANYKRIWGDVRKLVGLIRENARNPILLYGSYVGRLAYVYDRVDAEDYSFVNLLLLLSCICDRRNTQRYGEHLLRLPWRDVPRPLADIINEPTGKKKEYFLRNISAGLKSLGSHFPEQSTQMEALAACIGQNKYEEACNLLEQLSKASPLDSTLLYFRIYLAYEMGDHEFAYLLSSAAMELYPREMGLVQLSASVVEAVEGPEN